MPDVRRLLMPVRRDATGALRGLARLARTRPVGALAAATLLAVALLALLADVVATHDPVEHDVERRLERPGADHYFGTDGFGRDVFSRVVHGARVSLCVGLIAVVIATTAGVSLGTLSAYRGGTYDLIVQRGIDVMLGFPFLVLALVIVVALNPSPTAVAVAVGIALAPHVARLSRAVTLAVKQEPYIEAARMVGAGPYRIIWRHVVPNGFPPVLAQASGYFGVAVVAETALSFLGLGVPAPFPSWGRMLQEGVRHYFEAAPWATVFPGLALSLTVLSSALLSDALRDLLDPRRALLATPASRKSGPGPVA